MLLPFQFFGSRTKKTINATEAPVHVEKKFNAEKGAFKFSKDIYLEEHLRPKSMHAINILMKAFM